MSALWAVHVGLTLVGLSTIPLLTVAEWRRITGARAGYSRRGYLAARAWLLCTVGVVWLYLAASLWVVWSARLAPLAG